MAPNRLDIEDCFSWEEDLPRPQWDLIKTWVENCVEPGDRQAAWIDIVRQWLDTLRTELGQSYQVHESDHFFLLCGARESIAESLAALAESSRHRILTTLQGVAAFRVPGKQVVIALEDAKTYYTYISAYFSEGHHGATAGVHIREGYAHVAINGSIPSFESTLAHELTHASLNHLTLPKWAEEGLAQLYEHDITGRGQFLLTVEMSQTHKRYWTKHGLDSFWRGEGFSRPGKVQELSYQLAEILMRLLIEDHRPRWFGMVKGRQRQLFSFVRYAERSDCGESAAREYLGFGLSDLARLFLGKGDWSPEL